MLWTIGWDQAPKGGVHVSERPDCRCCGWKAVACCGLLAAIPFHHEVLVCIRNFGIVGKLCRPQHGTQWKYDPENCKQNQIYHWRKKSSAIEGLNIFGNIMFVVVRHGKSFLYFNLCIQYKGFGKNNQPCFCHKNLLNYDTKQEEKNGRVYEFCAGLRPVYG